MFIINGIEWEIVFTSSYSTDLMRSDGSITVGMSDYNTKCVYLSNALKGAFLRKVLAHELVHCFCFSYDISMPIEQELSAYLSPNFIRSTHNSSPSIKAGTSKNKVLSE